jgi:hypothetical protein
MLSKVTETLDISFTIGNLVEINGQKEEREICDS